MSRERRATARIGDAEVAFEIDSAGTVVIGEERFRVTVGRPAAYQVTDQSGRSRLVHAVPSDEGIWVHDDGRVFIVDMGSSSGRPRHRGSRDAGDLSAPMPATVLSIAARPGMRVAAGELLLLLEAMKMELPIVAPHDGIVKAVRCEEGELVQPGTKLVELE